MDWLTDVVMFAWYASVLMAIGAAGAVRVLSPPAHTTINTWTADAARLARLVLPLVCVALISRLLLQTWQAFGSDQPLSLDSLTIIVTQTPWGTGWLWQVICALVAWGLVAVASPQRSSLYLCAAIVLGGSVGLTGHAAGADAYATALVVAHGLHVLAAGLWLGTLTVVLLVSRPSRIDGDASAAERLAHAIDQFSPQAVVSVGVLVVSGVVAAWQHVGGISALLTPYGFVLIAKVVAFGAAAMCGFYNWRVVRPLLATHPEGVRQLRSVATMELVLGLVALVLTSILTSMSMPEH
jgi:putative copper resistance protein D